MQEIAFNIFIALMVGAFAVSFVLTILLDEFEQYPRGLRWLPKVWDRIVRSMKFILLRTFYPETLKKEETPVLDHLAKLEELDLQYRRTQERREPEWDTKTGTWL